MNAECWPLFLECVRDFAAGAKTLAEFVEHRARRTRLAVIAGTYAESRGYPLVLVNGWEVGGADGWCSFCFSANDPMHVGEALLELDAL